MKKVFSISLLFIFTFSTVGVIANSYTCNMMKMKVNECCDKTNKSCCSHEVKLLKVKDDFVSSAHFSVPKIFSSVLTLMTAQISNYYSQLPTVNCQLTDPSPPGESLDRLSFIQSFLI